MTPLDIYLLISITLPVPLFALLGAMAERRRASEQCRRARTYARLLRGRR